MFKNYARTAQLTVYRVVLHKAHCAELWVGVHPNFLLLGFVDMSAERQLSVRNGKGWDKDVGGGTPLRGPTPVTTPTLTVRERQESETHSGAGVSSEEDSEEESSDDRSPLNKRVPNKNLRSYGAVPKTRVSWDSLNNIFRLGGRSQPKTPPPEVPRCECHPAPQQRSNKARNKLLLASALTLVFMIAEVVGAYVWW